MSRKAKGKINAASVLILAVLLVIGGIEMYVRHRNDRKSLPAAVEDSALTVEFLNVGQGDSTFIVLPDGRCVLIDGGNTADGALIAGYLSGRGIKRIDLLVATHPHEDHIGGLPEVFAALEIKELYMPEIAEKDVPTTKTYEKLIDAALAENCEVRAAAAGDIVMSGDDYKVECLSPSGTGYGDLNNYSAVLKLTCGDVAFLFEGDAESAVEQEILDGGYDVSADVIKVGHHGSRSSSSAKYLNSVSPSTAVISCGKDNKYGHPHDEIVKRLEKAGCKVLRTDLDGTIIMKSDGKGISVACDPSVCLDGNR